jgi:hypothetical protein
LVEAASEAETVISSLRKIRQDDNVWQELYQDITKLAEKQNAQMQPLPSQLKVFVKGWIMPNCIEAHIQ